MNDFVEGAEEQEEEENITEVVREAFLGVINGLEEGEEIDEEAVKLAMIGAGATFKSIGRLYNKFCIDSGLAISAEDRRTAVDGLLEDADITSEEGFDAAVDALVDGVKGTTERSAGGLIRGYGKKNEIEVFAKPKTEGSPRNPFVVNFHQGLISNPEMDEQGLRDIILALPEDQQTNPTRWFSQHNNIRKTVNAVYKKCKAA